MKKLIVALLALACGVCLALGISACGKGGHKHSFSSGWTSDAQNHWHVCTGCDEKDSVGAHEWELTQTINAPTCGAEGQGRYTCSVCGKTKVDVIAATGEHTYGADEEVVPPTCYTDGYTTHTCTKCGYGDDKSYKVVPATGLHNFSRVESNETEHWEACSTPGCPATQNREAHSENPTPDNNKVDDFHDYDLLYKCSKSGCGHVMRTEKVSAPGIPVSMSISFAKLSGGTSVPAPAAPQTEDDSYYTATLYMFEDGNAAYNVKYTYTLSAENSAGDTFTPNEPGSNVNVEGEWYGVRPYIYNEYAAAGEEYEPYSPWGGSSPLSIYSFNHSIFFTRVPSYESAPEDHSISISFRFERWTGTEGGGADVYPAEEVYCEIIVNITVLDSRSAASPAATALIIDDEPVAYLGEERLYI